MSKRERLIQYIAITAPLLNDEMLKSLKEFESSNKNLSDDQFYIALQNAYPWLDSHFQLMNSIRIKTKLDVIEKKTKGILSHLWFYTIMIVLSILVGILSVATQ